MQPSKQKRYTLTIQLDLDYPTLDPMTYTDIYENCREISHNNKFEHNIACSLNRTMSFSHKVSEGHHLPSWIAVTISCKWLTSHWHHQLLVIDVDRERCIRIGSNNTLRLVNVILEGIQHQYCNTSQQQNLVSKVGRNHKPFCKTQIFFNLPAKPKKTNPNSSHSVYTYPHIFKPRRKKTQLKNKLTKPPPLPSPWDFAV